MTHRRILLLFLVFLTILSGATYAVLHRTGAAKDYVQELIGRAIRRHLFKLDGAEIDLTGGRVTIREFQLSDPKKTTTAPILSVSKVEVDVETNPLGELGVVRQVAVAGLEINLSLVEGQVPDLEQIFEQAGVEPRAGTGFALPAVLIRDSRVNLTVAPGRPSILFTELDLELRHVEGEPGRMQLRGSMLSPMGHTARIEGGGNPGKGNFRAMVILEDIPILPEKASVFREEAAQYLDAAQVAGRIEKAVAWMEFDPTKSSANEPPYSGGFRLDFADVDVTPPGFPYRISGARGAVFATTSDGGTIKLQVDKKGVDGDLSARGSFERCLTDDWVADVRVDGSGILIGARLHDAIAKSSVEEIKEIEAAFEPTAGRFGASVHVRARPGTAKGTVDTEVASEVTLDGVQARYRGFESGGQRYGFPIPLREIHGKILAFPHRVVLQDIRAQAEDGAPLAISGDIGIGGAEERSSLDITATGLQFSDQVRDALAALIDDGKAVYDEYAPNGKTDVIVELRSLGEKLSYAVELRPRLASATYSTFPYRVDGLRGKVRITDAGVWIDLAGSRAESKVLIDGRFLFGDPAQARGLRSELWIKADGLSLDPDLYKAASAFEPQIAEHWQRVRPRGSVDAEVTMWKEVGDEHFGYDVHLGVRDGSLLVRDLPLGVEKLRGSLFLHGTGARGRCDISPMRGEITNRKGEPPARILVQGSILDIGGDVKADITSIVQHLQFTEDLGKALHEGGVFDLATWQNLKLDGFADVTAHHEFRRGNAAPDGRYVVRLRDVSSAAGMLPGRAQDLHGEIVVDAGVARFETLEGKIDETTVTMRSGRIFRKDKSTVVDLVVDANTFPLDDRLANAMSGVVRDSFLARRMRGRARLNNVHVVFSFPDDGSAFSSEFHGDVEARDIAMDVGLPGGHTLEHLTGTVSIKSGVASSAGGMLQGQLKGARFELSGHQIYQIDSKFEVDAEKLLLRDLTFEAAGGRVRGGGDDDVSFRYDFTDEGRIRASLAFDNLRLTELLRPHALSHSKVRGTANGRVRIDHLEGLDFLGMRASGEVSVRDGHLGTVPLFSAIYKHIKEERRPQFTTGRVVFDVADGRIRFSDFDAASSLLKLSGKGTLDMDGYMDIDLNVPRLFGSATDILIVPPLLNQVFAQIVSFKVFGYLRDPHIEPRMLLSKPIERQPLAPIAPVPVASPSSESRTRSPP